MYLSQLLVNTGTDPDKPRPGLDWIKQTYRVHQRIWMAFPDDKRRTEDPFFLGTWAPEESAKPRRSEAGFLFRIEPDRPTRILVQSLLRPDWDYAFQNAPYLLSEPPQVRDFEPIFRSGESYRFRLVMLMVKRRTSRSEEGQPPADSDRVTEHPIRCLLPPDVNGGAARPDPNLTAWRDRLFQTALRHGFEVSDDPRLLRVQPTKNLRMKSEGRKQATSFNAATFDGLLTCTDPAQLRNAVINGVGRGKAFGMGLLSLAVLR